MKQGTVSVLFGCHSPVHALMVWLAWCKLYRRPPNLWQTGCIFLHDIGHWGKDYLDNVEGKRHHWELGAKIAGKLFGPKGYLLCAGHSSHSGFPESKLRRPDKYSWYIAPRVWLLMNLFFEPKIRNNGMSRWDHTGYFKREVKKNIESGRYGETHDIYLKQREGNNDDTA